MNIFGEAELAVKRTLWVIRSAKRRIYALIFETSRKSDMEQTLEFYSDLRSTISREVWDENIVPSATDVATSLVRNAHNMAQPR